MPRPVLAEEIDCRIARALESVTTVRVAYFFGSRARGSARIDSDLDLAVALPRELDGWGREQVRRDVIVALTDELGPIGERTDVVDLDRAFGAVAFDAIARGRCVVARSEAERVAVETRIARRYDDEAPLRERQSRAAEEAFPR